MKIDQKFRNGYDYLFKNNRLLFLLLFLRTIGYCFPIVLESKNSETGYRNLKFFPKRVVEILKKWGPPRQVTFKCPPPPPGKGSISQGLFFQAQAIQISDRKRESSRALEDICKGENFIHFNLGAK